jgi:hypothetical protein
MEKEFPDPKWVLLLHHSNYQPRQPETRPIAAILFASTDAPPEKLEPPPFGFLTRVHLWALNFK